MTTPSNSPIGFANRVGTAAATTLGLSVALPLAVFVLPDLAVATTPGAAAGAFGIASIALLPLVLCFWRFSLHCPRSANLVAVANRLHVRPLTFSVAWLSIAGYGLVAALLLGVLGRFVPIVLAAAFEFHLDPALATAGAAGLVLIKELLSKREWWGARTVFIGAAGVALVVVLVLEFLGGTDAPIATQRAPAFDRSLAIAGVFAALLWSVDAVWQHKHQLRYRSKGALTAVLTTWALVAAAGTLTVLLTLKGASGTSVSRRLGSSALALQVSPVLAVGMGVGIFLAFTALSRTMRATQRIAARFWPADSGPADAPDVHTRRMARLTFALVVAASTGLALWLSTLSLAAAAGAAYLWCCVSVCAPVAISAEVAQRLAKTSTVGALRKWASLALLFSLILAVILPWSLFWGLALWLVMGWVGYASLGALRSDDEREEALVDGETAAPDATCPVLAVLTAGTDVVSLATAANLIASRRGGVGRVLKIVPFDEALPPRHQYRRANRSLRLLRRELERLGPRARHLEAGVRVGPSILDVLRAEQEVIHPEMLLLGLGALSDPSAEDLQAAYNSLSLPTALLQGRFDVPPALAVIHARGTKSSAAMRRLAGELTGESAALRLLCPEPQAGEEPAPVPAGGADVAAELAAEQADRSELNSGDRCEPGEEPPETEHFRSEREGWRRLRQAPSDALVVVETAHDSVLGRAMYGGMPMEVAQARVGPTLIYKPDEPGAGYLWRRITERIMSLLPPLGEDERAEVLTEQNLATRGSKDFYFLMTVASVIAIAGLIANSTAVVIGAMIVAPLMQPIVGLAMGIAVASPPRLRSSAKSIVQGAMISITVSAIITLLFPIHEAPSEVTARVSPNLLDLLVALAAGGAASYASARKSIAGSLPGVAISVALVPPLCVVGFGLGEGSLTIAGGAFLLFLTNLAGIILVSALVFMLFGFRPRTDARTDLVRRGVGAVLLTLAVVAVPLAIATFSSFEVRQIQWRIKQSSAAIEAAGDTTFHDVEVLASDDEYAVRLTVLSDSDVAPDALEAMGEIVQRAARQDVALELMVLQAQIVRTTK